MTPKKALDCWYGMMGDGAKNTQGSENTEGERAKNTPGSENTEGERAKNTPGSENTEGEREKNTPGSENTEGERAKNTLGSENPQGEEKEAEEEWKRKVKIIPKLKEGELELKCEWGDCAALSSNMKESFEHLSVHIQHYLLQVLNPQPSTLLSGGLCLTCGWRDCGAQILGSIIDFNRHVYFHIFHVRLKCLGAHVARILNLGVCLLGPQSCNWIPELPDNLQCAWGGDCKIIFDNSYHFYSHVSHHATECEEGAGPLKCEWNGCDASVRDRNKLKEHLRSHTQEKQVACPTCGGLFATQSKLTDHILRQATSQC
ncbi:hypothetical protein ACOMHN_054558 [Nucella lapillus]